MVLNKFTDELPFIRIPNYLEHNGLGELYISMVFAGSSSKV